VNQVAEQRPFRDILAALRSTDPEAFTTAAPFPHIVYDGVVNADLVKEVHGLFRTLPDDYWEKSNDQGIEVKWRSSWKSEYDIPEQARELVRFFNSGEFLRELSRLTGIPQLIPDPYYSGGGFNYIRRGGHLDVHVDGNWHDAMAVHRRLNLILYLNSGWKEEWGGELKLYDASGEAEVVAISPVGNRLMIFETTDLSFHGHPEPILCPEDEGRSSIILYYYTSATRPPAHTTEPRPHSALWRSKNYTDKRGNRTRA
jgi:hypothetical protein